MRAEETPGRAESQEDISATETGLGGGPSNEYWRTLLAADLGEAWADYGWELLL